MQRRSSESEAGHTYTHTHTHTHATFLNHNDSIRSNNNVSTLPPPGYTDMEIVRGQLGEVVMKACDEKET